MTARTYDPIDRPAAWIWHADPDKGFPGAWCEGRIHSWHRGAGGWWAVASWYIATGLQCYGDVEGWRIKDRTGPVPDGAPAETVPGVTS